jgi:hypothetical protein
MILKGFMLIDISKEGGFNELTMPMVTFPASERKTELSSQCSEETIAMGREIESRPGKW